MKKNDAIHLGIELGPRSVRAVLLESGSPVRMAQRAVEGPPEAAWEALAQVLQEIKPPPRTHASVALLPPFVDTQTLQDVPGERGRSPSALRLRLQRLLNKPLDDYVLTFVEQGGIHKGDLYVAFSRKEHLRELYRAARKHRVRIRRVEPWYQALPRPWIVREPELDKYPAIFVGVHQGRLTYLGRRQEDVELITHSELPDALDEVIGGIENVYYELAQSGGEQGQSPAIVISLDDKTLYGAIATPLGESGFSVLYPEDDEQVALGDFVLAAGTALDVVYAGLKGNLWTPGLEEELEGRRIPPIAAAPVVAALLVMALGAVNLESKKAELTRAIHDVEAQITEIKPDADRAAQLKNELDHKLMLASTLEDALFGKGRWSQRLDELFGLLGEHGVAVSQVALSTPARGAPTATVVITSPKAEAVFAALKALELRYPKVTPAPVLKQKVASRTLYGTTVSLEVAR
ncbi:hypothetical protein Ocepr_2368 (plasmid) [Oceanithermus profundus DSM 14977]|uniref:Uncharacterized protein n=1 Tax=Oceanithermus profundus (strain DSM 14977 / NBRC 100410 / VKM B-2274 / 506) TaxID=670487 RepID=E4UAN7_OCEP5|nr:hypothetical protein [Oceanithermus profundus]ADR37816.1 hypothetical protein Ocepr_2368 [Oceanithermus profundus DSM 14977]